MPRDRWFLVSKPLRPPFSDGSNVLVRDLVAHAPADLPLSYFGDPAAPVREGGDDEVIAAASMGHAPGMGDKVRVLANVVRPSRRRQPLHFFFTPNRVTSSVVAGLRRLQPRRLMVQTLMSSHGAPEFAGFLRPLDAVVVLSDHTARALERAGLPDDRVHRIHPGIEMVEPIPDVGANRRLLYAGDLDEGVARRLIAVGSALSRPRLDGWTLTIAARPKAHEDGRHRAALAEALAEPLASGRVELSGEIPDMDGLMRACSLQLFVADHVRKKVDLPLVVLEGLARGLGLISLDFAPLAEIFERAETHGLVPGRRIDPGAADESLVEAVVEAASSSEVLLTWSSDARELASREFSIERMADRYAELYERLEREHVSNG